MLAEKHGARVLFDFDSYVHRRLRFFSLGFAIADWEGALVLEESKFVRVVADRSEGTPRRPFLFQVSQSSA